MKSSSSWLTNLVIALGCIVALPEPNTASADYASSFSMTASSDIGVLENQRGLLHLTHLI
jgi:hypothetical protein